MKGGGRVEQMSLGMGIALHTNQVHPKHVSVHHLEYRLMREIQKYTHTHNNNKKKPPPLLLECLHLFFFFSFFAVLFVLLLYFPVGLQIRDPNAKRHPLTSDKG